MSQWDKAEKAELEISSSELHFHDIVDICRHFENMVLFKNHWPQTVAWGPDRGYSIWEEGIGLTFDVVKSSPKRQRTEMFFEDVLQGFVYKQYYRALKFQ